MRVTLFILLACTSVFAGFAVPSGAEHRPCSKMGVVLETDVQSSRICRLVVVSDEYTVLDRGRLPGLTKKQELRGTYRFWHEPVGRVLYVYDDSQSLLCRVTNPTCVTVLEVLE